MYIRHQAHTHAHKRIKLHLNWVYLLVYFILFFPFILFFAMRFIYWRAVSSSIVELPCLGLSDLIFPKPLPLSFAFFADRQLHSETRIRVSPSGRIIGEHHEVVSHSRIVPMSFHGTFFLFVYSIFINNSPPTTTFFWLFMTQTKGSQDKWSVFIYHELRLFFL